jgi:RNA polymerase subunit RPABC4/transcription elongation factor Spt4
MNAPSYFLALDDSSTWIRGVTIATIIVLSYVAAIWLAMITWAYRDASQRMTAPWMRWAAAGLVAAFNIPGLLLYLAIRPPEPLVESYNRQLEAEAFLREVSKDAKCTACQRSVEAAYAFCPYCTAQLQAPCTACERLLRASWTMCPYCAAPRAPERAPAARPAATPAYPTYRPVPAASRMQRPAAPRVAAATLSESVKPMTGPAGATGG